MIANRFEQSGDLLRRLLLKPTKSRKFPRRFVGSVIPRCRYASLRTSMIRACEYQYSSEIQEAHSCLLHVVPFPSGVTFLIIKRLGRSVAIQNNGQKQSG